MRKLKFVNRHHIKATSRGGGNNNNIVHLDSKHHAAWHFMFGNMTLDEVRLYIDIVMSAGMYWDYKMLSRLQKAVKDNNMKLIKKLIEED